MKHLVYNFSGQPQELSGSEISQSHIPNSLVNQIVETVAISLSIPYDQRVIFNALLKNNIKDWLDNRDNGILQQYSAWVLDIAVKSLIKELGLREDVKVNHEYAEHAKLKDIIEAIKKQYTNKVNKLKDKK